MKILKLKNVFSLLLTFAILSTPDSHAKSTEKPERVAQGPDEDKTASIYLATKFIRITGSFDVVPASPLDTRDSLSGTFHAKKDPFANLESELNAFSEARQIVGL